MLFYNPFSPLTHSHRNLLGLEFTLIVSSGVKREDMVPYDENRTLSLNSDDTLYSDTESFFQNLFFNVVGLVMASP